MGTENLLKGILRDILEAEAAYRSAMKVYKDQPMHQTRVYAESRWYHVKEAAKAVLAVCDCEKSSRKS